MSEPVDQIANTLVQALESATPIDAALDRLLEQTGGRAAGLWRLAPGELRQVGFRAVEDMPETVRTEFAAATRNVPLSETGLGIVKAAISRAPSMATVEGMPGLGASAGWLARFACRASLAVPVEHANQTVGVLAVSSAGSLEPESAPSRLLIDVAAAIGASLAAAGE